MDVETAVAHLCDDGLVMFECPGCQSHHAVWTKTPNPIHGGTWQWNGSLTYPTFFPSLLVKYPDGRVCHSFVKDGKIQFLGDCTHDLAGKTVDIPAWGDV